MTQSRVRKSYRFLQIIPGGGFKAVHATESGEVRAHEVPAFALVEVTESGDGDPESTYRAVIGLSSFEGGPEIDEYAPCWAPGHLGYCGPGEDATELFADEARDHFKFLKSLAVERQTAEGDPGSR